MANSPNSAPGPSAQVPTYRFDEKQAEDAYQAFAAIQRIAKDQPELADNEYLKALRDTAYARFLAVFEAL